MCVSEDEYNLFDANVQSLDGVNPGRLAPLPQIPRYGQNTDATFCRPQPISGFGEFHLSLERAMFLHLKDDSQATVIPVMFTKLVDRVCALLKSIQR